MRTSDIHTGHKLTTALSLAVTFILLPPASAWGQGSLATDLPETTAADGIAYILQQVEANNKDLQANAQLVASQKLENKTVNNLPDPTVQYAHVWDKDDSDVTEGELIISQSFDFPTLYATRNRLNRHRSNALDAQALAYRQNTLLHAKELCLDIVYLQQQQALLDRRMSDAQDLDALYRQRLNAGDASILETNKIRLELLNVRTESRMNQSALSNKLKELSALNGNQPLAPGRSLTGYGMPYTVDDTPLAPAASAIQASTSTLQTEGPTAVYTAIPSLTDYPADPLPTDFSALCTSLLAADPTLQALESERCAAHRQLSASKQGWLPRLEVGYRRNTESGHPLNGMVVGFSIPLFENRSRVRQARSMEQNVTLQHDHAQLLASAALWQLYEEASSLHQAMQEYEQTLAQQQDLDLLRQALTGGEISLVEYFLQAATVYQSLGNLLALQHQYHIAMARIYKSRL